MIRHEYVSVLVSVVGTTLLAIGMLWGFSTYQQNMASILANYGARISTLEQERTDDRHDAEEYQSQVTSRLDTIMSQLAQMQVSLATKADKR